MKLTTVRERYFPGPTFRYGLSGLLVLTSAIYKEQATPGLEKQLGSLTKALLGYYRSEYPFGFKNWEIHMGGEGSETDRVDLLEGAPGALLALLSIHSPSSSWHDPFLISAGG